MMNVAFSPFAPVRKRNLFAQVVEELGSRIVGGDFKPGDTLPNEADLGRELGASRSVVREAVKSLASKGLMEPRTRVGTTVLQPTQWNLLDLDVLGWRYAAMPPMQFFQEMFEIRRMIEPEAASLAARTRDGRRSRGHGAGLPTTSKRLKQSSSDAIDADIRFHRSILQRQRTTN